MRNISHRYQIKITQTNGREPVVQGVEEINVNGRRRVRHLEGEAALPTDDWFDSLFTFSEALPEFDLHDPWWSEPRIRPAQSPRRIRVETVEPSDRATAAPLQKGWQRSQQALQKATRKVSQVARNIPAAWQAALRELSR